jgi:lipid-binding SYLF domain-containing protein
MSKMHGPPAGGRQLSQEMIMKSPARNFILIVALAAMAALPTLSWGEQDKTDVQLRLENASAVLRSIMNAPEKGIPQEVVSGAKCIAVVPHLLKGGFIFGAKRGRGVVTCRVPNGGWSAPAFLTITGGDWGAQIGVEGIDLVMLFMTEQGARHLMDAKFQIGGEASAAAGPIGRHASAGTDWKADTQILTYSRAKGAFAGITIGGSYVQPDRDSILALYGRPVTVPAILTGKVATPRDRSTEAFLNAVRTAKAEAKNRS